MSTSIPNDPLERLNTFINLFHLTPKELDALVEEETDNTQTALEILNEAKEDVVQRSSEAVQIPLEHLSEFKEDIANDPSSSYLQALEESVRETDELVQDIEKEEAKTIKQLQEMHEGNKKLAEMVHHLTALASKEEEPFFKEASKRIARVVANPGNNPYTGESKYKYRTKPGNYGKIDK